MPEYVRSPYVQDPRTMLDLMRMASADRSRSELQRAQLRSQGVMNIGQLIAGTLASIREERDQKAAMQAKAEQAAREDAFKVRDQQLREADLMARMQEREQAAERQNRMDAEKRGTAAVSDMGGYGPLAESQVDDVMQSPAAGRTRYSFGPGQANGPEVMPNAQQLQEQQARTAIQGMGGTIGPNGQVVMPPKPEPLRTQAAMVNGKRTFVRVTPNGFADVQTGQPVQATPIEPARPVDSSREDASAIADAIFSGQQPPEVTGLYRLAGPVRSELAKRGFDLAKANLDWKATQRHLTTLNGAQQTRLRQAIITAQDSLDVIQNLSDQWKGGRFPMLNRVNLKAAKNGAYGRDAASIATQLEGQITDVTSELANAYMGGNSPTDHALQLAAKNLSADWDQRVLGDMIKLARTNLQIRRNSIEQAAPITSTSQQQTETVEEWVRDAKGNLVHKKGGG